MNSDRFSITLKAADANNIVLLLDFNQILSPYEILKADNIVEHTIALEDLHAKIGLFSLLEANSPEVTALSSQANQDAAWAKVMKEGQKVYLELYIAKNNGPWKLEGEEILQNRNSLEQAWSLMGLMGTNSTAILGETLKLGVRIANKAQGNGGLKGSDYVHISGTWRKNTKIESKKKDEGVEALQIRISSLETLLSTFGAPSANLPGTAGLVPPPPAGTGEFLLRGDRSWENPTKFATPAMIEQAILDWVGAAPGHLNTLIEFGNAINNDANFAATVINQLALKATLASPTFTGFITLGGNLPAAEKVFRGSTDASGNANFAHGINIAKIAAIQVLVNGFAPVYLRANFGGFSEYNYFYNATTFYIVAGTNNTSIINAPYVVVIKYTA